MFFFGHCPKTVVNKFHTKNFHWCFENKYWYYEMNCLFTGIISQIPFLPKMIFKQNDVMKNCTMNRSIVFSIQMSPFKDDWLLLYQIGWTLFITFSSLFPNNLVHSDWVIYGFDLLERKIMQIFLWKSKITNFEVPNSAIG